jgi:electron transfer DM13
VTTRKSIFVSAAVVGVAVLWYLFRPEALVINKTVSEPFPAEAHAMSAMAENHGVTTRASAMADSPAMASSAMVENHGMTTQAPAMAHSPAMASSAMAENHGMTTQAPAMAHSPAMASSGLPQAEPVQLATGRFHKNAHETAGAATIYRLADGRLVLRLTDFATSNGPDVRVYLVAADDVQDEAAAKQAGFVDLGALKGNIGNQNYDVPAGLDLSKYRAVSIWCRRFSVNFGAAPLVATPS